MMNGKLWASAILTAVLTISYVDVSKASSSGRSAITDVKTVTDDGVTIYGQKYFSNLNAKTPMILLFHQAGSNGRGEYADIIPWLNKSGFRVMVWDQRSGGEHFGSFNRTVNGLPSGTPTSYCDAYPDLQAALDLTVKQGIAEKIIVWGSSYSAALVVQLAAKNSQHIDGVAAFSPASGGPLKHCRARQWIEQVKAPVLVMRPKSEMARESSIKQRALFDKAGVTFRVIDNGVHGSSMLVDSRTEHDMSHARAGVVKWLKSVSRKAI